MDVLYAQSLGIYISPLAVLLLKMWPPRTCSCLKSNPALSFHHNRRPSRRPHHSMVKWVGGQSENVEVCVCICGRTRAVSPSKFIFTRTKSTPMSIINLSQGEIRFIRIRVRSFFISFSRVASFWLVHRLCRTHSDKYTMGFGRLLNPLHPLPDGHHPMHFFLRPRGATSTWKYFLKREWYGWHENVKCSSKTKSDEHHRSDVFVCLCVRMSRQLSISNQY